MGDLVDEVIARLVAEKSVIRGKKVLQKLVYFVQEGEGVRLGLSFRMRHYGPFSDELDELTEEMGERGVLSITDSGEAGFTFRPGKTLTATPHTSADSQVDRVIERFGNEGGLTLELLATIHFLAERHGYDGSAQGNDMLVGRVQAWKGRKFQDPFIRDNIHKLQALGYL